MDKFGKTMYSIMCLRERELQIDFSQFEPFYPISVSNIFELDP